MKIINFNFKMLSCYLSIISLFKDLLTIFSLDLSGSFSVLSIHSPAHCHWQKPSCVVHYLLLLAHPPPRMTSTAPHFSLRVLSLPPWGCFAVTDGCSQDLAVLQDSALNPEILPSVLAAFLLCSCGASISTSQLLIQNHLLFSSSLWSSPWLT